MAEEEEEEEEEEAAAAGEAGESSTTSKLSMPRLKSAAPPLCLKRRTSTMA
jgi:hypothetical protein